MPDAKCKHPLGRPGGSEALGETPPPFPSNPRARRRAPSLIRPRGRGGRNAATKRGPFGIRVSIFGRGEAPRQR
jgi:hypothetical protein